MTLKNLLGMVVVCGGWAGVAGATPVIQTTSYRVWGSVSSENPSPPPATLSDAYDTTAATPLSAGVDGLYGNLAHSEAGRDGLALFARAESREPSATSATGSAYARTTATFTSDSATLALAMFGTIPWDQSYGHTAFSSIAIRIKDLTSGDTLLDYSPVIPPATPTSTAAPWSTYFSHSVDVSHTFELSILANAPGYEPFSVSTVSATVVPEPGGAMGAAVIGGALFAGVRRRKS
jgi:hypothetical protein